MELTNLDGIFKPWTLPEAPKPDSKPQEEVDDTDAGYIDFTEIMKNKEAYFDWEDVIRIINYFYDNGMIEEGLFFHTLAFSGRRVSEILGKPPFSPDKRSTFSKHKGLRPIDFHDKTMSVEFEILKKNHIKKVTRSGSTRNDETLKKLRLNKEPKRKLLPLPESLYSLLKDYISKTGIGEYDRIFTFSRMQADRLIKIACKKLKINPNLGMKRMRIHRADGTSEIIEIKKRPHCHMLRHSFSIHMLKKNPNNTQALILLSQYLDHSSLNMTRKYLQFANKEMEEFIQGSLE